MTDRRDDLGSLEPGLDQLIGILACAPTPDELAGEPAALAMFRASQPQAPQTTRLRAARTRRRPRRVGRLVGAVALALAGGFAAAAYAEVLPAPIQQMAYRVLGFAGVPDVHQSAPHPARPRHPASPAPGTSPTSSRPGRPAAPAPVPSQSASPAPSPGGSRSAAPPQPGQLSLTAAQRRITAGLSDSFTGTLTDQRGRALAGQPLTLLERAAGQAAWRPVGHASTGASGRAVLTVSGLTVTASFRLAGPDGTQSLPVRVITVPPVSASVSSGPRRRADTLTASSPLADPGDLVVLQVRSGGSWQSLSVHRLSQADQAAFVVKIRLVQREYRVVLLRTRRHGASASSPVVVPPTGG